MRALSNIYIHAYDGICALGTGRAAIQQKLFEAQQAPTDGVQSSAFSPNAPMFLGLAAPECTSLESLPTHTPKQFKSRNNALLYHAFLQLESEWQRLSQGIARHRIAVILGSSNSGIAQGEAALLSQEHHQHLPAEYCYAQQEYGSPAQFLAWLLGVNGPAYTISTACSSGAKALISGARLLQHNVCDLAIVGGADVVSQLTAQGFLSLEAVDGGRCQPFAQTRKGIHLGEGAALLVLSREPAPIQLSGWGESSDAYHIAAPQPDGVGAELCMRHALGHAQLDAQQIDYLNLHGTATRQNDAMEAQAVARVLSDQVKVSSTKSLTGHTLGAAGAIEALFCCMTLQYASEMKQAESSGLSGLSDLSVPPHWVEGAIDTELPLLNFALPDQCAVPQLRHVMSNSFGFGGSNASLIFSKV